MARGTEYTRDSLGRITEVRNPLGYVDRFEYDALGRIVAVTDRNGNVTRYVVTVKRQ